MAAHGAYFIVKEIMSKVSQLFYLTSNSQSLSYQGAPTILLRLAWGWTYYISIYLTFIRMIK